MITEQVAGVYPNVHFCSLGVLTPRPFAPPVRRENSKAPRLSCLRHRSWARKWSRRLGPQHRLLPCQRRTWWARVHPLASSTRWASPRAPRHSLISTAKQSWSTVARPCLQLSVSLPRYESFSGVALRWIMSRSKVLCGHIWVKFWSLSYLKLPYQNLTCDYGVAFLSTRPWCRIYGNTRLFMWCNLTVTLYL